MGVRTASIVGLCLLFGLSCAAQPVEETSSPLPNILVAPPREFRQQKQRLADALEEKEFLTAATYLDRLLAVVAERDYFISAEDDAVAKGAKSLLWEVLSELPSEGLEAYRALVERSAAADLQDAVRRGDPESLATVADRWLPTRAGIEARLLLARIYLDRNQPYGASSCLAPLTRWPHLSAAFEPEVTLLQASCCLRTNRPRQARVVLDRLAATRPQATIRVSDREINLNDSDVDPLDLLAESFAPRESDRQAEREWRLHRGDARRRALGRGGPPIREVWQLSLAAEGKEMQAIHKMAGDLVQRDAVALPQWSPLAVAGQVLCRTPTHWQGVDASTGEIQWRFPPEGDPKTGGSDDISKEALAELQDRIWEDSVCGQLSSDGERVFLVDDRGLSRPTRPDRAARLAIAMGQTAPNFYKTNMLVALDVNRQGAVLWMAEAGAGLARPLRSDALFLGPPLPLGNHLFALAHRESMLQLVKLDATTGRQLWRLPYARIETKSNPYESSPSISNAVPSYAQGVLFCPTSAGAIVAVDAATRRFLWGYRYAIAEFGAGSPDATVLVTGGHVVVTPRQADLHCLNLATGELRWRQHRADFQFVAGAYQDRLLLVGRHRLSAVQLADGQPAWPTPFVAIPAGGMPAGRGFVDGRFYYLPTTDPELLQIDLTSGEIQRHSPSRAALGNIICGPDHVFAQGPLRLIGLEQRDRSAPPPVVATPGPAPPAPETLAGKKSRELVSWLARDDYRWRETASRELTRRGGDVVPPLVPALAHYNAEVQFRAVTILISLLDSDDPEVAFQARLALLATRGPGYSPQSTAALAVSRERRRREPTARKTLQDLNATVQPDGRKVSLRPSWKGNNQGLLELGWLSQLQTLELRHSEITDDGLRYLRGLHTIESLNLYRTQVTSAGLAHLEHLAGLRVLMMQQTQIDDRGLQVISQLNRLRAVNLLGTACSAEGVAQLQSERPDLKITF